MKHTKMCLAFALALLLTLSFTAAFAAMAEEDGEASVLPQTIEGAATATVESAAEEALEDTTAEDTAANSLVDSDVGIDFDEDIAVNAESKLFGEERVLLVTAKNNNESVNYSIVLNVTYYGAEGEVLETETKDFMQLKKGYDKNFVFRPGFDFADYLIEIEKTVYEGDCWKTLVDAEFGYTYVWVYGDGRDTRVRQHLKVTSHSESSLVVDDFVAVVFDENGEIFDIFYRAGCWINPRDVQYKHFLREMTVPDSMVSFEGYDVKVKYGGAFIEYDIIAPEETPDYDYLISNGYIDPVTGAYRNPKDAE